MGTNSKKYVGLCHTLTPQILNNLIHTFQLAHSYLCSSLTCPMNFTHYHSPLNRDKIFGSLDLVFLNKLAGNGYTQIMDLDLLPKVIKWARLANHASPTSSR